MTTQTIHQATVIVPASERGLWENVVSFLGSVAKLLGPYFGPANLDFLEREYRASLPVHDSVKGDGYLQGGPIQ